MQWIISNDNNNDNNYDYKNFIGVIKRKNFLMSLNLKIYEGLEKSEQLHHSLVLYCLKHSSGKLLMNTMRHKD